VQTSARPYVTPKLLQVADTCHIGEDILSHGQAIMIGKFLSTAPLTLNVIWTSRKFTAKFHTKIHEKKTSSFREITSATNK